MLDNLFVVIELVQGLKFIRHEVLENLIASHIFEELSIKRLFAEADLLGLQGFAEG